MGDFNFPSSVMTWHTVDGVLLSRVAGHRVSEQDDSEGDHVRQQAAKLCDLAVKYNLTQQVGVPTREKKVLDLVWSNDPTLVSNIQVDSFQDFTDQCCHSHYLLQAEHRGSER